MVLGYLAFTPEGEETISQPGDSLTSEGDEISSELGMVMVALWGWAGDFLRYGRDSGSNVLLGCYRVIGRSIRGVGQILQALGVLVAWLLSWVGMGWVGEIGGKIADLQLSTATARDLHQELMLAACLRAGKANCEQLYGPPAPSNA